MGTDGIDERRSVVVTAEASINKTLAVLIDADNAQPCLIELLLKEVTKFGTVVVRRIYGDWTTPNMNAWKDQLNELAILPIQQFRYTKGKNATDSALIIDAMDLLYTRHFNGFCIVSSDSDFTRLAGRIREAGLFVIGIGRQTTPRAFINACDRFIYTENLNAPHVSDGAADSEAGKAPVVARRGVILEGTKHDGSGSASELTASAAVPQRTMTAKLEELSQLLRDAYQSADASDEWVWLAALGIQLNKMRPDFDPRSYGHGKLSELIRASGLFDVKEVSPPSDPSSRHVRVKWKVGVEKKRAARK